MTRLRLASFTVAAALGVALGACGGTAKPTYQLTQSEAAVRAAEEVNAEETPQAALHLKMARDQVREAKALIVKSEHERARHLLRRAEADANLAIALSKEAGARAEANEAKRKVDKLRAEVEGN